MFFSGDKEATTLIYSATEVVIPDQSCDVRGTLYTYKSFTFHKGWNAIFSVNGKDTVEETIPTSLTGARAQFGPLT